MAVFINGRDLKNIFRHYVLFSLFALPWHFLNIGTKHPSSEYKLKNIEKINKIQIEKIENTNNLLTSVLLPRIEIINEQNIMPTLPPFLPKIDENTKFLLMQIPKNWNGECGGLANQMWRLAVLFSMAKSIGRFPGISNTSTWTCDKLNSPNEIENTFPILYSSLRYLQTDPSTSVYDNLFEANCCRYINITNIFNKYKQNYLIVPPPPQSPKFLENVNAEIRQLFRFSKKINIKVAAYIDELITWKGFSFLGLYSVDQSSHKFCVHTRRGDFGPPKWPMHARTEKNFTENAIKFILGYLHEKYKILNISIVLLGEDKDFLRELNISQEQRNKIYIPKAMNRGEDMCFGIWACDSLLLTASSSTYAWWIGYLLEQTNAKHKIFHNF
ncbi:hypothetical protein Mgra_00000332 [Meloidogyne graminicola]|uniref:L-Fucosyltransferase n=1 Tax=Meloidogyne graminicola TaxID=189291 RepID=A0A8T0A5B6_9BILA|nr:hypothetical protein Mgra_00000332 [Meloidogyne graminicola]